MLAWVEQLWSCRSIRASLLSAVIVWSSVSIWTSCLLSCRMFWIRPSGSLQTLVPAGWRRTVVCRCSACYKLISSGLGVLSFRSSLRSFHSRSSEPEWSLNFSRIPWSRSSRGFKPMFDDEQINQVCRSRSCTPAWLLLRHTFQAAFYADDRFFPFFYFPLSCVIPQQERLTGPPLIGSLLLCA